ncbi:cingulin [Chrysoperla carnea]|uniref:cingulin n=1 Tax=Chrysoperla carnea TaxID=189513 RepID=UPI001D072FDC|nr:cingulin [Chrysoperla carnea]
MNSDLTTSVKDENQCPSPPRPTVLNIKPHHVNHDQPAETQSEHQQNAEDTNNQTETDKSKRRSRLSFEFEHYNDEENKTIHGFNCSNITVIEVDKATDDKTIVNDGSDSGVELCGGTEPSVVVHNEHGREILQRALSSTSGGGYSSSSCNGADDGTLAFSCDSSIVSCCSNYEDAFDILATKNSTLLEDLSRHAMRDERASENGSESSSVTGGNSIRTPKSSLSSRRNNTTNGTVKKKVAVTEPSRQSRNRNAEIVNSPTQRSRSKSNSSRINSTKPPSNSTLNNTRIRSKDKLDPNATTATKTSTKTSTSTSSTKTKPKIDTNTTVAKRDTSLSRSNPNKLIKTRTPASTPSDDGRWPSTGLRSTPTTIARSVRGTSLTNDNIGNTPMVSSAKGNRLHQILNVESKATALEKYATLPRRRRERTPDCSNKESTTSRSRDPSLTRTPVPPRKPREKESLGGKFLPPYPVKRKAPKIKIYHETSVQTALTSVDLENVFSGNITKSIDPSEVEKMDCGVQVDRRNEIIERLENQIKELNDKNLKLLQENKEQNEKLNEIEQQLKIEREEKQAAKDELNRNAQRVLAMVHKNSEGSKDGCDDSLLALETQFKNAGEILIKQEQEISELHAFTRSLQRDLQKSKRIQEQLMQQRQEMEAESIELKEFMQAEKSTLSEVLRETEEDVRVHLYKLKQKESELQRQQEECKHLVRISEQRRQENLTLQARFGCLEARSREILLQHGAAVSGAAVALSGLIGRLESLVTQLVASYNISEQDLEDAIYHNEAYSNSESSDGSPIKSTASGMSKRTPSPKRGASFVSAVISAIKNAAAQTAIRANSIAAVGYTDSEDTDSGELLDSETEPVLMMESVLEDVTLPDTHSHNMVSSTHSLMSTSLNGRLAQSSESLHNLSQSILARQQQERCTVFDKITPAPAFTLVDQVIDVDNMVTKLLKVLRIIQIENDSYVDELNDERTQLTDQIIKQKESCKAAVQQLQDWEKMGAILKTQLSEANKQLGTKTQELNDAKTELQQRRTEIDRLNEDICKLSLLCSQTELKLRTREEEANATLKQWQETGKLPTADVLARLVTARHEIPALKEKLLEKERELGEITEKFSTSKQVMTESWNQAISETRRQYEAIDAALETLLSIQSVVEKCPPLAKLQHELEEISFQCASSIPLVPLVVASDFNANANHRIETSPVTPINGTA